MLLPELTVIFCCGVESGFKATEPTHAEIVRVFTSAAGLAVLYMRFLSKLTLNPTDD